MGSHTKTNSGGATTPLSPRLALQLAAPHTWPAAIMPVLVAAACALANTGSLDVGMAWLLLLICILMQASVNTFNDYFDFIKGTDTAEDNVEECSSTTTSIRARPRAGHRLSGRGPFLLGLYVVWKGNSSSSRLSEPVIVVMYSGGKTPLSYLPVGEAVSGIVMGGLIPLACYQVLSGTFTFMALLWAAPTIIGVGLIMMTNNTCDIEKDIEASRRTLPVLLGREKARTLYHALMVVWVLAILAIIGIWFPRGIVVLPFLALGCYPLMMGLWKNPLAAPTRISAMGQICSVNVALGAFYAAALLL